MEKEFVPYELAVKIKELGFAEPCIAGYSNSTEKLEFYSRPLVTKDSFTVDAPTFSQVFRFFREKYDLFGIILPYLIIGNQWYYKITNRNNSSGLPFEEGFDTYEEAELNCLKKLIQIVKEIR